MKYDKTQLNTMRHCHHTLKRKENKRGFFWFVLFHLKYELMNHRYTNANECIFYGCHSFWRNDHINGWKFN